MVRLFMPIEEEYFHEIHLVEKTYIEEILKILQSKKAQDSLFCHSNDLRTG